MIRLEKLTIRKLGNVAPNTELHFGKRGALLIGKNGTGKTTLLNVIVAALRSQWGFFASMGDDGFDIGYTLQTSLSETSTFRLEILMRALPARRQIIWRGFPPTTKCGRIMH